MTLDIAQIALIGGPTSVISVLIYVLINAYLAARKDRREDRTSAVTTDAGYIDNTKMVLDMMRQELERVSKVNVDLHTRVLTAEALVRSRDDILAISARKVEDLEDELKEARQVIATLRGQQDDQTPREE